MPVRRSKIARLPEPVRRELNQRLLDGQQGPHILPWLNSLPEAKTVIAQMAGAGGKNVGPFDDNNLSEWRNGGYQDWLRRREQLAETRELAAYSLKLAQAAGGDLSEGAAAILSGQLLQVMESLRGLGQAEDPAAPAPPERLLALSKAIDSAARALASVRAGDHNARKLALDKTRLDQAAQALLLEEKKFQRLTCELFIKWAADQRAQAALAAPGDNSARINAVGQLMFGPDWKQ
jgi:hypothetical protein